MEQHVEAEIYSFYAAWAAPNKQFIGDALQALSGHIEQGLYQMGVPSYNSSPVHLSEYHGDDGEYGVFVRISFNMEVRCSVQRANYEYPEYDIEFSVPDKDEWEDLLCGLVHQAVCSQLGLSTDAIETELGDCDIDDYERLIEKKNAEPAAKRTAPELER